MSSDNKTPFDFLLKETKRKDDQEIEHQDQIFDLPAEVTAENSCVPFSSDDQYDDKEDEIDKQLQEIYLTAIASFKHTYKQAQFTQGKSQAEMINSCARLLDVALKATQEKAKLKIENKKITKQPKDMTPKSTKSRNEIVASVRKKQKD